MTPEQRRKLEVWAIEWALTRIQGRWVERATLAARRDGTKNPAHVLRSPFVWSGTINPPDCGPSIETWTKPGHISVWRDWSDDEPLMRIPFKRVVEYVKRKHGIQRSGTQGTQKAVAGQTTLL